MELLDTTKRKKLYFDIVLDKQQYYFNNDKIRGKVVLITPKSLYVKRVKLSWKGAIKTQLGTLKHDQHVLFNHSEYLYIDQQNNSFYLKPGDYYEFLFELGVPNQMAIPSFTESEFYIGGSVEYIIEAFLERPTSLFPRARTHRFIPLLDRVSITQPAFVTKKSIRTKSKKNKNQDDNTMLELSLLKTAFKRGQNVEAMVQLFNYKQGEKDSVLENEEDQKKKVDVSVALIRMTQVIYKERLFLLPEVVVESAQLSLSSISENNNNQSILSGTCHLTIPPSASPSMHENGHLLHISYIIRAQKQQPDQLLIECPIVIGTYPIDLDEKPQVIIQPSLLKGVVYEEIPNTNEFGKHHQISSLHHQFLETTAKIHHSSIHSGSSFSNKKKNRTSSLYDDEEYNEEEEKEEGFTSIYSMSSSREDI